MSSIPVEKVGKVGSSTEVKAISIYHYNYHQRTEAVFGPYHYYRKFIYSLNMYLQ